MLPWRLQFRSGACFLIALAILPLASCYHYVPVADAEPGVTVRARLNATGAESLTQHFGPGVSEVWGTLLSRDGTEMNVLVAEYYSPRVGTRTIWNESVRVPAAGVEQLQRRKLHAVRSALLGVAVIGGAALTFIGLELAETLLDAGDDEDPGPTQLRAQPHARVVIFRLPIGR